VRLTLKDTFHFSGNPEKVTERFISFYEPELITSGKAVIRGGKGSLTMIFDPDVFEFSFSKTTLCNHKKELVDVWCMDLDVKRLSKEFTVQVIFERNIFGKGELE